MIIPQTTSYEQLLKASEMRLFEEKSLNDLEYIVDLIEELDRRVAELRADRYNGSLVVRHGGEIDFSVFADEIDFSVHGDEIDFSGHGCFRIT